MTLPPHVLHALDRLEEALEPMLALRSEVALLRASIERNDAAAAYLVLRMIVESLLLHACRERGVKPGSNSGSMLENLKGALTKPEPLRPLDGSSSHSAQPQSEPTANGDGRVFARAFWTNIQVVQQHSNRRAHSSVNDVYVAPLHRAAEEHEHLTVVMHAVCAMVPEFFRRFPPPARPPAEQSVDEAEPTLNGEEHAEPHAEAGDDGNLVDASPGFESEDEPDLEVSDGGDETEDEVTQGLTAQAEGYADLTATRALLQDEARRWLASTTGLGPRRVHRRLRGVHGGTKLKNLFPEAFPQLYGADASNASVAADPPEPSLTYDGIAQLTVRRARDLELTGVIARLSGQSPKEVQRALANTHGKTLVSNAFPWYDIDTLRDLSVATALRFGLVRVLASHLGRPSARVLEQLRAHHGRTALKTVFPELA